MSAPQRIQRRRTKGWRAPEGAVYVGRGSKWGNPYTFELMQKKLEEVMEAFGDEPRGEPPLNIRELAVEAFRCDMQYGPDSPWWWFGPHNHIITALGHLHELRGKNLMCWCPLDQPCHADVLLELANQETP